MSRRLLTLYMALLAVIALPAAVRADSPATRPSVTAVLPFNVLGPPGRAWVGVALQEGLAAGLARTPGMQAVAIPPARSGNEAAARQAVKAARADFVIFGSIQLVDDQMRIGGTIVSVTTGRSVGQLRSDGNLRDLFAIEDALADRAGRLIAPAPAAAEAAPKVPPYEMLGTNVTQQPSTYFDGNLSAVLAKPDRYQDQYNNYLFNTWQTAGWGWCGYWGYWGCGWGYWGCCGCGGPPLNPYAGPIGTW